MGGGGGNEGGNSKQMSSDFSRLEFKLGVLAVNTFNMPVY